MRCVSDKSRQSCSWPPRCCWRRAGRAGLSAQDTQAPRYVVDAGTSARPGRGRAAQGGRQRRRLARRLDPLDPRPCARTRRRGRAADGSRTVGADPRPSRPNAMRGELSDPRSGTAETPRLHEPLGAGGELAAMGARGGGIRRAAGAARRRRGRPARRPRSGSASASAGRRPGSPSTRACSACSASSACRRWSSCRAAAGRRAALPEPGLRRGPAAAA